MERASRALCAASVWAACLLLGTNALAADSAPAGADENASPKSAPADPATRSSESDAQPGPEQTAAAAAYQRALAAYAQGDVNAALGSMRESYQLSKRPELLYNVARLEDELEDCQGALNDYGRYLQEVPQGQYREAATQASEQLARTCKAADATPKPAAGTAPPGAAPTPTTASVPVIIEQQPPAPLPALPPARYWTTARCVGWSAIAAGTVAGAGALYFRIGALKAHQNLQRSVDAGPPYETRYQTQQNRDEEAFGALAISSGALLASGALLLILAPNHRDSVRPSAFVYAQPGLLGASIWRSF